MDTYYRLTRAELFAAIEKGIRNLKADCLDPRDMDLYTNVTLAAFNGSCSGLHIGLWFKTQIPIFDWARSPKLLFGNLLCISPSQRFDDIIWATISNRDANMLNKKGIIFVELCDFNKLTTSEIIFKLLESDGQTIMVESPTYFRSLWPVLMSLRDFDMEKFSLKNEIVKTSSSGRKPQYADNASYDRFQDEEESSHKSEEEDSDYDVYIYDTDDETCIKRIYRLRTRRDQHIGRKRAELQEFFDASQKEAFEHCLDNRVAIVQGPPGCGKTFLGVKLVETLLEMQLDTPIVVMTYKNHALDEFLKHCSNLPNCHLSDIVRIGGQSKEPILESCNLGSVMRGRERKILLENRDKGKYKDAWDMQDHFVVFEDGSPESQEYREILSNYQELRYLENTSNFLSAQIRANIDRISTLRKLENSDLLASMNEEQLELLILNADWSRLSYEFQRNHVVTRQWVETYMLPELRACFGKVSVFLEQLKWQNLGNERMNNFYKVLLAALTDWLPSKEVIGKLRNIEDGFALLQANTNNDYSRHDEIKDKNKALEEIDKDHVMELQEARQVDGVRNDMGKDMFENTVFLEKNAKSSAYCLSDFPTNMAFNAVLLQVADLWSLSSMQRIQFVHSTIKSRLMGTEIGLQALLSQLERKIKIKESIMLDRKFEAAKTKKVVGVTITGASIHHDLIHDLAPKIVIVEEAAEILESSLLAALHPKVEHLILIGDHKQLRPQVDTYSLVKKYNFDVSMMERLILSNMPHKMLKTQNRMRPEFSVLLRDIYPELKDNTLRVEDNSPPRCLKKSMFFWTHDFLEDGETNQSRSKCNSKEAEMVMALSLFLLSNGYKPSQLTILAGYLGQQQKLRALQKEAQSKHKELFAKEEGADEIDSIQIQTIDMYQGDENDIVIVSLTRSNPDGTIGFMNTLNRRCVAQSRAKCGMYLVGNLKTFTTTKSVWTKIIREMGKNDCVNSTFDIQCKKHRHQKQLTIGTTEELMSIVNDSARLCNIPCGELFPCGNEEHACKKACCPSSSHHLCMVLMSEVRNGCGHDAQRRCHEDLNRIPCETKVEHVFPECGHKGQKKCYVLASSLKCPQPCPKKMTCQLHNCPSKCGDVHHHNHHGCKEVVKFTFSLCGHESTKACSDHEANQQCTMKVQKEAPKCKHLIETDCSTPPHNIVCDNPCEIAMNCGAKHKCKNKCGDKHSHNYCTTMIQYAFECGHPSPQKKKCSAPITEKCHVRQTVEAHCGHKVEKECYQDVDDAICQFLPCPRSRTCGHKCPNVCGVPCDQGKCFACEEFDKQKLKKFKEKARQHKEQLEKEMKNSQQTFKRFQLLDDGDTKAEYLSVFDRVTKYIKDMHEWHPIVTKIEKVRNIRLEARYEDFKLEAYGDMEDLKFHGTTDEGVEGIIFEGFR